MKAMVLSGPGERFVLADVPDPIAGPGEAVARVLACGSGLTIQHIKAGRIAATFPRIIGHEIAGEIVALGPGVEGFAVGDMVTAYYQLFCGACRWCAADLEPLCERLGGNVGKDCDGGYADYIKLPAHNFIALPEGLDALTRPAEVAVIADALATPYKVLRRARVRPGEVVAVIGAGGGVGIHQLVMAKWAGARPIAVERAAAKFDACRAAGAETVIDAAKHDITEALRAITGGAGVDVVVDYVSSTETLEAGLRALGRRGRLVTLGGAGQPFKADALSIMLSEQVVLGSRYVSRRDVVAALDLVARGEVRPIVSDIRPLGEAEALHERIEAGEVIGRAALLIG